MRLTKAADYGIRLMAALAGSPCEEWTSIRELAERLDIPRSFLGNIVQKLSASDLVETVKGAHGGLRLKRPAEQINVLQVLEALEGPIAVSTCQREPGCKHDHFCNVHPFMEQVRERLVEAFKDMTLAHLATPLRNGDSWGKRLCASEAPCFSPDEPETRKGHEICE